MASNAPRCTKGAECCYVTPQVRVYTGAGPVEAKCPHLDGDQCGLRAELGSWEAVHSDPRYQEWPKPLWVEKGIADCGDYFCADCLPE